MGTNASLRLVFSTDEGMPCDKPVQIKLHNPATGECRELQHDPSAPLLIKDLLAKAGHDLKLEICSKWFKSESRWCTLVHELENEISVVLHGCSSDEHGPSCKPPTVADRMDEKSLTGQLVTRLAGGPADGSDAAELSSSKVIWVDGGDEVLVHLDSIRTVVQDGMILVSIDLESDQTGRASMIVSFAVGKLNDPAGLVAVTEEFPSGNGLLASRWGRALQAASWYSLLSLATDHATERSSSPLGITAAKGTISLTAGAALKVGGATK